MSEPRQALPVQTRAGAPKSTADILPAKRTLTLGSSQYEIITEKRMANCTFYRARDIQENRDVGIKELDFRQLKDRKIFDLAAREAELLQSINHIEGLDVVKCLGYHSDEANGKFFIITEFLEGQTLQEAMDGGKRLEYDHVRLITQLLDVVAPLHKLNPPVIHRDIRPANVMLCKDGSIKLFDFGFSVSDRSTGTTFCAINNFGFTAPEVAQGFPGDARSDLFSVGAIHLYRTTGKTAFDLCDMGSFRIKLPEGLPAADRKFLEKALAYVPDERFQSAAEMKAALPGIEPIKTGTHELADADLHGGITQLLKYPKSERLAFWATFGLSGTMFTLMYGPAPYSPLYSGGGVPSDSARLWFYSGAMAILAGMSYLGSRALTASNRRKLARLEAELADKRRGLPAAQNESNPLPPVKAQEAERDWSELDPKDIEVLVPCDQKTDLFETLRIAEEKGYVSMAYARLESFLKSIR
jgi:hypothetical protein